MGLHFSKNVDVEGTKRMRHIKKCDPPTNFPGSALLHTRPYPARELTCAVLLHFSVGNGWAVSLWPHGGAAAAPCFYSHHPSCTVSPPLCTEELLHFQSGFLFVTSFHCLHCHHPCLRLSPGDCDILPNGLGCFCPRSLRYILKTADRGILVRCKSDCARPLVKTLGWCPISLGAKASLVTWETTHLGFSLPLLLSSLPLLQPSCF